MAAGPADTEIRALKVDGYKSLRQQWDDLKVACPPVGLVDFAPDLFHRNCRPCTVTRDFPLSQGGDVGVHGDVRHGSACSATCSQHGISVFASKPDPNTGTVDLGVVTRAHNRMLGFVTKQLLKEVGERDADKAQTKFWKKVKAETGTVDINFGDALNVIDLLRTTSTRLDLPICMVATPGDLAGACEDSAHAGQSCFRVVRAPATGEYGDQLPCWEHHVVQPHTHAVNNAVVESIAIGQHLRWLVCPHLLRAAAEPLEFACAPRSSPDRTCTVVGMMLIALAEALFEENPDLALGVLVACETFVDRYRGPEASLDRSVALLVDYALERGIPVADRFLGDLELWRNESLKAVALASADAGGWLAGTGKLLRFPTARLDDVLVALDVDSEAPLRRILRALSADHTSAAVAASCLLVVDGLGCHADDFAAALSAADADVKNALLAAAMTAAFGEPAPAPRIAARVVCAITPTLPTGPMENGYLGDTVFFGAFRCPRERKSCKLAEDIYHCLDALRKVYCGNALDLLWVWYCNNGEGISAHLLLKSAAATAHRLDTAWAARLQRRILRLEPFEEMAPGRGEPYPKIRVHNRQDAFIVLISLTKGIFTEGRRAIEAALGDDDDDNDGSCSHSHGDDVASIVEVFEDMDSDSDNYSYYS